MSRKRCAVGAVWVTVLVWCLSYGRNRVNAGPVESQFEGSEWKGKYQEAVECRRCHTQPTKEDLQRTKPDLKDSSLDFVLLTEYSIWKTHDKHAQAYAILLGGRSQDMGKALGMNVRDPKTGCMNCHAMSQLFNERSLAELDTQPLDGVSCTGCHGPSAEWRDAHNNPKVPAKWRLLELDKRAARGFRDLRDPETKATLCMSCHIGDAAHGKVVTHAMFAAGHPPLPPIEVATFARNQPRHWRDSRNVPFFETPSRQVKDIYHLDDVAFQQTKLALIGSVVALRQTMRLAQDRANLETEKPAQLWPELLFSVDKKMADDPAYLRKLAAERWPDIALAHSDCYACHHDLNVRSFRQERGFGYRLSQGKFIPVTPGRPLVRAWPTALLEAGIAYTGKTDDLNALATALGRVAQVCNDRPYGEPKEVMKATDEVVKWCNGMIAELNKAPYNPEKVRGLMLHLCKLYGTGEQGQAATNARPLLPDFESARQVVALLEIAYEELTAEAKKDPAITADLERLAKQVDLRPYTKRGDRLKVIRDVVEQASEEKQKPEDVDKFTKYLTGNNIGDRAQLEGLLRNSFLATLQTGLTNKAFTDALRQPETVKTLQKLSDQELQVLLRQVADYNPWDFKKNLRNLANHLERSQ
jgi:hypothetical protein